MLVQTHIYCTKRQCMALLFLHRHAFAHTRMVYISNKPGTDRTNVLESPNANSNYPTPWESSSMFNNDALKVLWVPPYWSKTASAMRPIDVGVAFATAGNFQCFAGCHYSASTLTGMYGAIDPLLNTVSASFQGMVLQFAPGEYNYLCTRNNNFSNRSQKGQLTVKA